ncbi:hypothetical protein TUMEXPCC7403_17805 [Tumidithrix helvetica PCC 7403]
MTITNRQILSHKFLQDMYEDDYFPNNLVDKAKQILIVLCEAIERKTQKTTKVYSISHMQQPMSSTNLLRNLRRTTANLKQVLVRQSVLTSSLLLRLMALR